MCFSQMFKLFGKVKLLHQRVFFVAQQLFNLQLSHNLIEIRILKYLDVEELNAY